MLDHFVQEYIDIAQKEGTHANHARTHARGMTIVEV
jgi:hypothetical protein